MSNHHLAVPLSNLDLSLSHLRQSPAHAVREMASSLEKRGQLNPVVAAGDSGRMILVDGFKRHQALSLIGQKDISVRLLPVSGVQMKSYLYILNRGNGFTFIEECLLIHEMVEKDGLLQKDVGLLLERHKSWVSRRLDIFRRLDRQIIEDIRVGLLPSGSGQFLALLPRDNQPDMSAAIQRDDLKVNQIKRLIELWRRAESPETRSFLIASSKTALELAGRDSTEKMDPRIPTSAASFYKAVRNLKHSASLLKNRSLKQLGAMSRESESILNLILKEADEECRLAVSSAYKMLERRKN